MNFVYDDKEYEIGKLDEELGGTPMHVFEVADVTTDYSLPS
ncbi:MAG: hypothetical protein Q4F54_05065 [Coriobacteriia bacterium]|nr:hypothetical protein [Coriobacteriia bacterium]